ncbi:ngl2p [Lichtheimia corymbifera JMRC:FSU:9682]|uniref:Ngl2p n=1 Tax=Lichtheimia corymbifera JMRC:FSU:9682 TaxID=1263082 RepID=A0A068RPS0_9FUNG|nr:ngl2p [Lichtheimia corymbifera JMRC:FSU:9682]
MGKADLETLKQQKKAKKLAQKEVSKGNAQQQLPPSPLQRSFKALPNPRPLAKGRLGSFTVMTFNILGQCLVKRELFPDSGEMLKWKTRRNMIAAEISMYKPDLMCLQEVDQYDTFYKPLLEKLGYKAEHFTHPKKKHGCLIGYNATLFEMVNYTTVDYDSDKLCPPTWITGNIAQIMALKHLEHPGLGIVLGNTHMYWRPNATYERLRQTAIYTERLMEFKNTLDSSTEWVPIVIGDFNTGPTDPGHAAVTSTELPQKEEKELEESRLNPGSFMEQEEESSNVAGQEQGEEAPIEPNKTMPTCDLVQVLKKYTPRWHSVYSCYGELDSAMSYSASGEPKFTNYTVAYKGTLDYILIRDQEDTVSATEILMLPPEESVMPSLPNRNFGSDHMCLVAKFDFTA